MVDCCKFERQVGRLRLGLSATSHFAKRTHFYLDLSRRDDKDLQDAHGEPHPKQQQDGLEGSSLCSTMGCRFEWSYTSYPRQPYSLVT